MLSRVKKPKLSDRQERRVLNDELNEEISFIEQGLPVSGNQPVGVGITNIFRSGFYDSFDEHSSDTFLNSFESSDDGNEDELLPLETNCTFLQKLQDWAVNCNIPHSHLNKLLTILREHTCFESLPCDSRTLLKTPRQTVTKVVSPGKYCHFGLEKSLQTILADENSFPNKLELFLNFDGLPISKSSGSQLWPILCYISNHPIKEVFAIGAFHGNNKPKNVNDYLFDLVSELKVLLKEGISIGHNHYEINVKGIICDAPARSFIACIKSHTGYFGC
jgi:hypothetical protein